MNKCICSDFKEAQNCTIIAIARILNYYHFKGYNKIPQDYKEIYDEVLKVAIDNGYTQKKGTNPLKIKRIFIEVLNNYGYKKCHSKGVYIWSFNKQVKNEIDNDRPVVMNIARGHYKDHSVTVCGYFTCKTKHKILFGHLKKKHEFVCILDGWNREYRYIDFKSFSYNMLTDGIGSFNQIIIPGDDSN